MTPSRLLTLLVAVSAVAAQTPYGPAATAKVATTRPTAGLDIRASVDKLRVLPDDVVTYTLVCRNLGPAPESKVTVEATLPTGATLDPLGTTPGGAYEPGLRRVLWQVASLQVDEQSAFTLRARLSGLAPGATLEAPVTVQSATMARPREGAAAAVEVVTPPLQAAFALPDVLLGRTAGPRSLIDVDSIPGQRVVERLEGLGVVQGFPDGQFRPNGAVTRAEATKMIVAIRQLSGLRDKTSLSLALSRPATVRVGLENSRGKLVRVLADGWALPAGQHQIVWDGLNDQGQPVALGVYRYVAVATDEAGVEQTLDGTLHVVTVQPLPANLTTSFVDVPEHAWYRPYVAKAEADGLVKGYPGNLFDPAAPIRRVENTMLVVRAVGLTAAAEQRMNESLGFADAADIPKWAVGYVAVATTNGGAAEGRLLVGYADNRFLPQQNLTRAEAAMVLERLLDREGPHEIMASGRISRGHAVSISGQEVKADAGGRFRQQIPVRAELELVPISVR
ncbi:MAG: S-layer homology domain-containing protein [Fimbriimonadaceae bacterium]|nr:S-layer homology domain-containing protein [Fimbriimonadaceae bacterium]